MSWASAAPVVAARSRTVRNSTSRRKASPYARCCSSGSTGIASRLTSRRRDPLALLEARPAIRRLSVREMTPAMNQGSKRVGSTRISWYAGPEFGADLFRGGHPGADPVADDWDEDVVGAYPWSWLVVGGAGRPAGGRSAGQDVGGGQHGGVGAGARRPAGDRALDGDAAGPDEVGDVGVGGVAEWCLLDLPYLGQGPPQLVEEPVEVADPGDDLGGLDGEAVGLRQVALRCQVDLVVEDLDGGQGTVDAGQFRVPVRPVGAPGAWRRSPRGAGCPGRRWCPPRAGLRRVAGPGRAG